MSEVKRYDAVHLRYEESNIRYGEGCEVEVVAAYDYDALETERAEHWRLRREAEADRDTAKAVAAELRAELAALKGGREAVHQWGQDGLWSDGDEKDIENARAEGFDVRTLYTAPPAQASAWVEVADHLPADKRDVLLYCSDTKEHFVGFKLSGGLFQFAQDRNGDGIVCRPSHWRYIDDQAAPTPGASDGKGGAD